MAGELAISPKVGLRHPSCFNTLVLPILSVRLHLFTAYHAPTAAQGHLSRIRHP